MFAELKAEVDKSMLPYKEPVPWTFITKNTTGRDQTLESTTFDGRHVGGVSISYRRE